MIAALTSCGTGAEPEASYKPALLPVKITVDPKGISVQGDKTLVTPIGVFSIGAKYALPERDEQTIYVIIRDRKKGDIGYDSVYAVRTGRDSFAAVVNGTTSIQVRDGQVTIDVTDGTIQTVEFKRADAAVDEQTDGNVWSRTAEKWNSGYNSSWYRPFSLSRWAYDDSTIDRWYGVGFVWFLLRLVLALLLGIVDLLLSLIFLLAQIAYLLTGSTGRNIVWGLFVLMLLVLVAAGVFGRQ